MRVTVCENSKYLIVLALWGVATVLNIHDLLERIYELCV